MEGQVYKSGVELKREKSEREEETKSCLKLFL